MPERLWKALQEAPLEAADDIYGAIMRLVADDRSGKRMPDWWAPLWKWASSLQQLQPSNVSPKALVLIDTAIHCFAVRRSWMKKAYADQHLLNTFKLFFNVLTMLSSCPAVSRNLLCSY